jgi:hypothetical protein
MEVYQMVDNEIKTPLIKIVTKEDGDYLENELPEHGPQVKDEERQRIKELMSSRIEKLKKGKHLLAGSIKIKFGEDLKDNKKVAKSYLNRAIEIEGVLLRPRHHTPYGIELYRTDKSEWISSERILCIGAFDKGIIRFKSQQDRDQAIEAIQTYNKYFEANFKVPTQTTEGLARLIEEEDQKSHQAKQEIAHGIIEPQLQKIRDEITSKRTQEMNDFLLDVAEDYERKARDIRTMLSVQQVEKNTMERILSSLSEKSSEADTAETPAGLFDNLKPLEDED